MLSDENDDDVDYFDLLEDDYDTIADGLPDVIFYLGMAVVILYGVGWFMGLSL